MSKRSSLVSETASSLVESPIEIPPSPSIDQKRPDEADYDFVSPVSSPPPAVQEGTEPAPKGRRSVSCWIRPILSSVLSTASNHIRQFVKQNPKERIADPTGTGGVLVDLDEALNLPWARSDAQRTKMYEASPLVLINGSPIVGKSTVAREMAREMGYDLSRQALFYVRQTMPPTGPVEVHDNARVVVLNMNALYRWRVEHGIAEPGSTCERCSLWPMTQQRIDSERGQELMGELRTAALLEYVIAEGQAKTTVIVTDSLPFSQANAETVQQYRTAARVSGRPFVHVYLTCSLSTHLKRLEERALSDMEVDEQPFRWRTDKGKGKAGYVHGPIPADLFESLGEDVQAAHAAERKWLRPLFLSLQRRVGSCSNTGLQSQFGGFLMDTTHLGARLAAFKVLGHMEDVQHGVRCREMDTVDGANSARAARTQGSASSEMRQRRYWSGAAVGALPAYGSHVRYI